MDNGTNCVNEELYLEKEVLAPYTHLMQVKGKQTRWRIVQAFNHWLQVPDETVRYILTTLNMLYNGSLLADDIQDNSKVRRGMPAAHCVYGVPLTLNATIHVFFLVLKRCLALRPEAAKIYCEEFLILARGQGTDIYWRDNFICPTEEEYKNMLKQKTGHWFLLGVRLMQLFSANKAELSELVLDIGLYFQIRDDYCNLSHQEALEEWPGEDNKQARKDISCFGEDLTEGKFSLPIIHAMKTPQKGEILSILRQRTEDVDLKKYCVSLLEQAGSLQYTRDVLRDLEQSIMARVARLGGNPDMEAVLGELMSWKHT